MEYREKGLLALISVLENNEDVISYEKQVYLRCGNDERNYFFNIYQLCGDILSGQQNCLKFGFNHPNWDFARVATKTSEFIEDSVLQCKKCKSNKIVSDTRQTRCGDEGTTVFATCTNCKKKWVTHGKKKLSEYFCHF